MCHKTYFDDQLVMKRDPKYEKKKKVFKVVKPKSLSWNVIKATQVHDWEQNSGITS